MILPSGLDTDAVGRVAGWFEHRWTPREAMLYAVGVGAGQEDPSRELAFTTENSYGLRQRVLPTFATVVGNASIPPVGEVALETLIHGVQGVAVHNELPVRGKARLATTVTGIHDKGAAALVALETVVRDAVTDLHYATLRSSIFIQGAGGWGGDRGESSPWDAPEREPDAVRSYQTSQGQALLYRLSGDRNPLHSDPNAAVAAGFTRPILHGLCTYGYAGRALLDAVCDGDPGRFGSLSARFAAPVYPGQRLTVTMWMTHDGAMFIAVSEAGLVLDRGVFEFAAGAGTR